MLPWESSPWEGWRHPLPRGCESRGVPATMEWLYCCGPRGLGQGCHPVPLGPPAPGTALGHPRCPVASPPEQGYQGPFCTELLPELEQVGWARGWDDVPGMLWEQGQDAWGAPGAGRMFLGGSRSRDATPALPWWAEGEGWLRGQLPAAGQAAPGARSEHQLQLPLLIFFLFNNRFVPCSWQRACLPPRWERGRGVCCKFPIFLIKLYRYGGNQIPSWIFLA